MTIVPHPPAGIGCYNNLDNKQHSSTELDKIEALEEFVKLCSTPLIPELTRRNDVQYLKVRD
jgi:protein disulfide-isomerase A1